jgi:demethylmenaquinone methyltransferase/2-methoxy-6-polyprenyl-1,4-benzoquinol methylase
MTTTDRAPASLDGSDKRSYVREMFTAIAPRYDLLNHVLSLNLDRRWRRGAVRTLAWERVPDGLYLDACAGTLDLAALLARQPGFAGRVIGADFVVPMLVRGRKKADRMRPVGADALALPFPAGRFDGATVGFGMRNLADLDAGLAELRRVLRPGARCVLLEFSEPLAPIRPLFRFYFHRLLPRVGRLVSKHRDAYSYLPASVERFPSAEELVGRMERAGFSRVAYRRLTLGVAAVHWGEAE